MRIDAERKLLAALSQGGVNPDTRAAVLRRLQAHSFAEPDNEVIYRALATLPALDPPDAHRELTQAATRLGFPDLDFAALFAEPLPEPGEIDSLLARLEV